MTANVTEIVTSLLAEPNINADELPTADLVIDELDGWTNPESAAVAPTSVSWSTPALATAVAA